MQTTLRVRRGQRRALMASRPTGRGQLLESRQRSLQRGSVPLPSRRHIANISIRHQSADGCILSADFTFAEEAFTVASIYVPCTAAAGVAFFTQHLLPNLPARL